MVPVTRMRTPSFVLPSKLICWTVPLRVKVIGTSLML